MQHFVYSEHAIIKTPCQNITEVELHLPRKNSQVIENLHLESFKAIPCNFSLLGNLF